MDILEKALYNLGIVTINVKGKHMSMTQPELMYLDFGMMVQLSSLSPELNTYLPKEVAQETSRQVTTSLQQLYPTLSNAGVIFVGAGYQMAQIMRPKFPIYHELAEVSKIHFRAKQFKSSLVTITAKDDEFSVGAFNKDTNSADPLYVFPALLVLPKNAENEALVSEIEETLSQQGVVTELLGDLLSTALQCDVAELHLITLSDITSFYATQLIQINLESLWEVMKHIVFEMGATFQVLGSGHLILWNGEEVQFIIPTKEGFAALFTADEAEWTHYRQTLKRLKLLLTDHGIQFSECVIEDQNFFKTTQDLASVQSYIAKISN